MTHEQATDFAKALQVGPALKWWSFLVQCLENSPHWKVLAVNRVSRAEVDLYEDDVREATKRLLTGHHPNDKVAACEWIAKDMRDGNSVTDGKIMALERRISELQRCVDELERCAGIETDDGIPF